MKLLAAVNAAEIEKLQLAREAEGMCSWSSAAVCKMYLPASLHVRVWCYSSVCACRCVLYVPCPVNLCATVCVCVWVGAALRLTNRSLCETLQPSEAMRAENALTGRELSELALQRTDVGVRTRPSDLHQYMDPIKKVIKPASDANLDLQFGILNFVNKPDAVCMRIWWVVVC